MNFLIIFSTLHDEIFEQKHIFLQEMVSLKNSFKLGVIKISVCLSLTFRKLIVNT